MDAEQFYRRAAIIDVETTGFDSDLDEIIQIAIVLVRISRTEATIEQVEEEYCGLREPSVRIHPGATKKHGLRLEDVRGHRLEDDRIFDILNRADFFIAHNAGFDRRFVEKMFPAAKEKNWYCTMNGIDWRGIGAPSKKLEDLVEMYRVGVARSHDALEDCRAVLELLKRVDPRSGHSHLSTLLEGACLRKRRVGFERRRETRRRFEIQLTSDQEAQPMPSPAVGGAKRSGCGLSLAVTVVAIAAIAWALLSLFGLH